MYGSRVAHEEIFEAERCSPDTAREFTFARKIFSYKIRQLCKEEKRAATRKNVILLIRITLLTRHYLPTAAIRNCAKLIKIIFRER